MHPSERDEFILTKLCFKETVLHMLQFSTFVCSKFSFLVFVYHIEGSPTLNPEVSIIFWVILYVPIFKYMYNVSLCNWILFHLEFKII